MSERAIKFRAWDRIREIMYVPTDLLLCSDGKPWAIDNDGRYGKSHHQNREDVALMQFTGLCDKYGEEIYEGDIVTGNAHDGTRILRAPVIWRHAGWYVGYVNGNKTSLDAIGKPEVLGNVYENPEIELLK